MSSTQRDEPGQFPVKSSKIEGQSSTTAVQQATTYGKEENQHQSSGTIPTGTKRKRNTIPPRTLNADPLAQFIGTDTIAEALINDVLTKVLLDTGAMIDLMPIGYAKATGLEVKPLLLITNRHVTMSLAAGQYSKAVGYMEFNLKIPGVSNYNMDRLALLSKDDCNYFKRVPVVLGTKTLDSTMYAMKEGEMELLDEVWRQTKNQRSFAKLWELVGF